MRDQRFPTARKYKLFRRFWHCALTVLPLPQQLEAPVRNGRLGHLRTKGVTSSQSLYLETENNSVTNHLAVLRLPTVVPSICTHVTVERQTRRQGSMSISIGAGPSVCRLRRARVGGKTADEEGRCHGGEHGALLLIGSVSRAPGSCPRLRSYADFSPSNEPAVSSGCATSQERDQNRSVLQSVTCMGILGMPIAETTCGTPRRFTTP